MDTVTYPNEAVQQALGAHTIAAQFNIDDPKDETKQLMRRFRTVWTPTLLFLDHHEIELRRQLGFVPPEQLPADVGMAIGMAHIMHAGYDKAFEQFRSVRDAYADQDAGAEALYWAGVAALRRDGNADELLVQWNELKAEYPKSAWWTKASFVDG